MRSCGFPQVKNGRLPTRDEVEENWVAQLNAARSRGDIGSVQLRYLAAQVRSLCPHTDSYYRSLTSNHVQRNTVDATYFFKNSATTGGRPNKRKTKTKDDPLPKDKPKRPYRPGMLRTSMEAKIMLKIRRRNRGASSKFRRSKLQFQEGARLTTEKAQRQPRSEHVTMRLLGRRKGRIARK
jgi:hypothetical protein